MIWKLAYKNIKQQKLYLIYFLSLLMGVSGFYGFISFYYQNLAALSGDKINYFKQSIFIGIMIIPCFFLLTFMILYGSNFIITARSQEYGLYRLLGMSRKKFRLLFFYENLIVFSIVFLFGILFGQFVKFIVIQLLSNDYEAVEIMINAGFDIRSILITLIIFLFIFIINGIVQASIITRKKLINLFQMEKKLEVKKEYSFTIIVLKFILSISILLLDYNLVAMHIKQVMFNTLTYSAGIIILIVISGFYAIFSFYQAYSYSFKYFVTKKMKYSKEHLFTFSLITKRLSTMNKMIAFISILLFIVVAAFSTEKFYDYVLKLSVPVNDYIVSCRECLYPMVGNNADGYVKVVADSDVNMDVEYGSYEFYTDSQFDDFQITSIGSDNPTSNSQEEVELLTVLSDDAQPFSVSNEKVKNEAKAEEGNAEKFGVVVLNSKYMYDNYLVQKKSYDEVINIIKNKSSNKNVEIEGVIGYYNRSSYRYYNILSESEFNSYCETFKTCKPKKLDKNQIYANIYSEELDPEILSFNSNYKFQIEQNNRFKNLIIYPDENSEEISLKDISFEDYLSRFFFADANYKDVDNLIKPYRSNITIQSKHSSLKENLQAKIFIISSAVFIGFMFLIVLISMMAMHITVDGLNNKKEFIKMKKIGYTDDHLNQSINQICILYFISPIILLIPNMITATYMFFNLYSLKINYRYVNNILGVNNVLFIISIIYIIVAVLATKLYKKIVFDF